MKIYTFAEREWLMRPLTLRQKKLVAATERGLRRVFADTAQAQLLDDTAKMLEQLYEAGCRADEIVLGEDFPKFLATILSPKGEPWKPEHREANAPLMEEIPSDVQAEVLLDFFSTQMNGMRPRPGSSLPSSSVTTKSPESSPSEDLPAPATSS
jgi:hypothetical protein